MKKWLAWILMLTLTTMIFCHAIADEQETIRSGDWEYRVLADGTAEITSCRNREAITHEIPEELDGRQVSDITYDAFSRCYGKPAVSPDHPSLAIIDDVLFNKIDKRLISYPDTKNDTVYIIPQGIKIIGDWAFSSSLTSVTIPDSVTSIGVASFAYCNLASITIPDSVTSIGDGAFRFCYNLTDITIPSSVTDLGGNPFIGCGNTTFTISPVSSDNATLAAIDDVLFNKANNRLIAFPCAKANTTFSYTIPDGTQSIGAGAFAYCGLMTSITIPDSVTDIGDHAFYNCSATLTVGRDSYAAQYAKDNNIPYTYPDADSWLNN